MAEEGTVISCHTVEEWEQQLASANKSGKGLVVDFSASWCGPSRVMVPILADIAKKFPSIVFLMVDVEELMDVAAKYEIRAMPTFIFIKNGQLINRIAGTSKSELEKKVALFSANA